LCYSFIVSIIVFILSFINRAYNPTLLTYNTLPDLNFYAVGFTLNEQDSFKLRLVSSTFTTKSDSSDLNDDSSDVEFIFDKLETTNPSDRVYLIDNSIKGKFIPVGPLVDKKYQ
jgi:hypothetical protein